MFLLLLMLFWKLTKLHIQLISQISQKVVQIPQPGNLYHDAILKAGNLVLSPLHRCKTGALRAYSNNCLSKTTQLHSFWREKRSSRWWCSSFSSFGKDNHYENPPWKNDALFLKQFSYPNATNLGCTLMRHFDELDINSSCRIQPTTCA